ncbi:MAG TPA: response regulator [Vulgatibacter sp.]|nr:response regulator [Vulgatibacter sp.]
MNTKILLIDADERARALVSGLLRARGFQVVDARSGEEADEALEREAISLALVDALLPDTEGLAWIRARRARGDSTPIVFVAAATGNPVSHHELVRELGVAHVLQKPISPEELMSRVVGMLGEPAPGDVPGDGMDFEGELGRLREAYREELPSRLGELRAAVEDAARAPEDVEAIGVARDLAHRLRGTAGSYGFLQVGEEAGRIEELLLQARSEGYLGEGQIRAARTALDQAVRAVRASPQSVHSTPYNSLARVLVVDDDLGFLALIREMGRSLLVEVIGAPSASEALDLAQACELDAVFIDAHLSAGDDAFELGRALRAIPGKENLPLAIVSVDLGMENRVAAAHSGASIFLPKPLSSQQFETAVRHLLAEKKESLPRILVVDDDPDFAKQVGAILEADGMAVSALDDVATMLEALTQDPPDLLLLDMDMPGMSGIDACRLVRMTPDWQDIPILFLTAQTGVDARIAAFEAGADDYLAKPVVPQEIRTRVRLRLERNRLLRERSDRDPLTGLLSRRALFEVLPARCAEARRHGRPLSIALLDLDFFKRVNDRHGHLVGDRVLMRLGRLLAGRFRVEDIRGRWGGEEFLVAFPGETPSTIRGVLERVLSEFSQVPFYDERGESFTCSFSVGIAGAPDDGGSVDTLIQTADRRLYDAKRAGRARIVAEG